MNHWVMQECLYILFHYTCSHTMGFTYEELGIHIRVFLLESLNQGNGRILIVWHTEQKFKLSGKKYNHCQVKLPCKSLMTLLSILQTLITRLSVYFKPLDEYSEINLTQLLGILKMHFIVNILHFHAIIF